MSEDPATSESGRSARPGSWYRSLDPLGRQRFHVAIGLALASLAFGITYFSSGATAAGATDPHRPTSMVLNITILAVLLATSRSWVRWAFVPRIEDPPRIGRPISKLSLAFLLGALILATCLRLPLIERPIQAAELDPLRLSIHGYSEKQDDGSELWRPASWRRAVQDKQALHRLSSKASLWLWRRSSALPDDRYHPVPIRLPSLLAGLASIILAWRILHWFGYRCAALFAGFFLAIHPAVIELDVQASGESLSLCFAMLAIASAYLALRTLKWRYWAIYGVSIFCCLGANHGAIHFAVGVGLFVSLYLLRRIWRARTRPAAWPQLVRFAITSLLAAVALIQITATAAGPPSTAAAGSAPEPVGSATNWLSSAWSFLSAGDKRIMPIPVEKIRAGSQFENCPSQSSPLISIVLSPALFLLGTIRLLRGNRFASPLILGGVAALPLAYAHARFATHLPPESYQIICALPGFLLPLSVGITSISDLLPNKAFRPYCTLVIGAAYLFLFSALTGSNAEAQADQTSRERARSAEFERPDFLWSCHQDGRIIRQANNQIDRSPPGGR